MEYQGYPEGAVIGSRFMYKVYGWMSFALAVTAAVAYYLFRTQVLFHYLMTHSMALLGLIILQFALVFILVFYMFRMSYITALALFTVYAASLGITMSSVFFVYTTSSIYLTFLITAGMFAGMSVYGYFTKSDLTSVGSFAGMALWGIIGAMLLNFWFRSGTFDYVISIIGVIVFVLLTAYDTQKIKQMGQRFATDQEGRKKVALLGALTLYLDFINLFLFLLRFTGNQRES